MNERILDLEKNLFKCDYMSNLEYMDSIIDDGYIECGKSGSLYDKDATIKELSEIKTDRHIEIYNYECKKIDDRTYLVHYVTIANDDKIYRTSIWRKQDSLKLLFHQASILYDNIELIKF